MPSVVPWERGSKVLRRVRGGQRGCGDTCSWRQAAGPPGAPGPQPRESGQRRSSDRPALGRRADGEAGQRLAAQIVQLRRTLGASAIVTSESGYALDISAADLDAARFEDLVAEGRRLSTEGEVARASDVLGDAFRLRRGEPLSEFAYAGFADAERAHLNELALLATECRVEADLELGHHNEQ